MARASGVRRKPRRKGDLLSEFLTHGIVIISGICVYI